MDIDSGASKNNIGSEDMNNASLPMTGNRPAARSEMGLCRNLPEMASFTSFVTASRSAVKSEIGVSPASSNSLVPISPLPENLTKRFQKLSLRSTSDSISALDHDDDDGDHGDDPGDDEGPANRVLSSSDVDMVEIADDDDERISSHRSKFDRIRLDEYRVHLVDTASEVIQSFYETCQVRLDSTNNNSNIDSLPTVLANSLALDIPHSSMSPYGDLGITLPISTGYQPLGHSEKPVSSTPDDLEKKRPRKKVSFMSAPSVKWFRKDDRIELPTRRRGKNPLIAVLRQLVSSHKYREENTCKLKVIPILKKRYKRLKA